MWLEVNFVEKEGDTQDVTQDVTQGVTQGKDLDKWIEYQVAVYPKITTEELASLTGLTTRTSHGDEFCRSPFIHCRMYT